MYIYYFNILLIIIWALTFLRIKKFGKLIFISLCFIQMFLISLFRYGIGFDYNMYRVAFFRMGMDGFSKISYLDWEWGFNLYTKLIVHFTKDPNIYFGITAFICLIIVAWFIYKYSSMPWLSVLLYVNLAFFYLTMNFLRQSMALSISLLSWQFLKKRKLIPFLLIIFIASTFHTTALIMIVVYFIVNMKPSANLLLLYGYGLLFLYIISDNIITLITNRFHEEYKGSVFLLHGLSFMYSIIPILFLIIAIIFKDKMLRTNDDNKFLLNMVFFSSFWLIAMSKHMILERMSYYTYIYIILFVPEFINCIKYYYDKNFKIGTRLRNLTKFYRIILKPSNWAICSILIIIFVYGLSIMHTGTNGAHGVFPYKSWI